MDEKMVKRCMEYIEGKAEPKTAEELMKSRYIAYTIGEIDYIIDTHDPATRNKISKEETEEWAKSSEWLELEIISTEAGTESDDEGIVEFKASFKENGALQVHHEKSAFVRIDGKWYYHGWMPLQQTIVKEKKVGRNDPCPCGSGKKYKKCCGK